MNLQRELAEPPRPVQAITHPGRRVVLVRMSDGAVQAEHYSMPLGCFSPSEACMIRNPKEAWDLLLDFEVSPAKFSDWTKQVCG